MSSAGSSAVEKVLLVDPSTHGGIAVYTAAVARSLAAVGVHAVVLGSRGLPAAADGDALLRWLPELPWGRPPEAGISFHAGRLANWTASAVATELATLRRRPDVVNFQAPLNRRFDAGLVRLVRRTAPVVWTAHDVVPFEGEPADRGRFAAIYRAADLVLVHGEAAAEAVRDLAGVEAAVIDAVISEPLVRVGKAEARRRLGLPAEDRMLALLGFVRPYKGYGLLADVWEDLGADAPLLLVMGDVVAGTEEEVAGPLDRLRRTGRADVRLGYAADIDIQLAIAASDAVLLPYAAASESGIFHQARALGVPVLASDAPQLAAAVERDSAGRVVGSTLDAWRAAVTGPLPARPPAVPPTLEATGRAHLEAFEEARRRATERRRS